MTVKMPLLRSFLRSFSLILARKLRSSFSIAFCRQRAWNSHSVQCRFRTRSAGLYWTAGWHEGQFINLALGGVDETFVFENKLAAREIALRVCLRGAIHRQFRQSAHAEQLLAEVLHLLLKARSHYPNLYPNRPVT